MYAGMRARLNFQRGFPGMKRVQYSYIHVQYVHVQYIICRSRASLCKDVILDIDISDLSILLLIVDELADGQPIHLQSTIRSIVLYFVWIYRYCNRFILCLLNV